MADPNARRRAIANARYKVRNGSGWVRRSGTPTGMNYTASADETRTSVPSEVAHMVPNVSRSNRNSGKSWSSSDRAALRDLARQNTPTRVIGLKLGRTEG